MNALQWVKSPYSRLLLNLVYAIANCTLGILSHSWWFITLGAYYAILAFTRFSVLMIRRRAKGINCKELPAKRVSGILLITLSFCLIGVNILASVTDRGNKYHEIIMIGIAVYAFTKIIISIFGLARSRHDPSPVVQTLRNISFADAVVSIYSLQRSMLVSFPGMEASEILLLNIMTGTAVYVTVLLLGLNLTGGKYINMAKSKIAQKSKEAAEALTKSYKKIESGVVSGYKKVETGVVDSYKKIEDKFVYTYLTRDGETVEDAKERLRNEKKQ